MNKKSKAKPLQANLLQAEKKIGYAFQKKELLLQAFVHSSYYNEHKKELKQHNERLEFLGDTVLGVVIAELLYLMMPSKTEGELSTFLSSLVNASSCEEYLKMLALDEHILLGKGQEKKGGKGKKTIMSDTFEALIGAMYLDGGLDVVKRFFKEKLSSIISKKIKTPDLNYKALLQEFSQKESQVKPNYKVLSKEGPSHELMFHVAVYIKDNKIGEGEGLSKKQAEQAAAKNALITLGITNE